MANENQTNKDLTVTALVAAVRAALHAPDKGHAHAAAVAARTLARVMTEDQLGQVEALLPRGESTQFGETYGWC